VFFRRLWCRIQRIPLPYSVITGSDDSEKVLPPISSLPALKEERNYEFQEKTKRKIRADSCEKDTRKSAKWSAENLKIGHVNNDCSDSDLDDSELKDDDTIGYDNGRGAGSSHVPPDRTATTVSLRANNTTHLAYQGRMPLAREDDTYWLSETDCFIRKEIVEVFTAQVEDMELFGHPEIGQVGVRCCYCAKNKSPRDRNGGHVFYPSAVAALQQAVSDLRRR
jgi:hypothetical protein